MNMIKSALLLRLVMLGFQGLEQKTTFSQGDHLGVLTFTCNINNKLTLVPSWLGDDGSTEMPASFWRKLVPLAERFSTRITAELGRLFSSGTVFVGGIHTQKISTKIVASPTACHGNGEVVDLLFEISSTYSVDEFMASAFCSSASDIVSLDVCWANIVPVFLQDDISFFGNAIDKSDAKMGATILKGTTADPASHCRVAGAMKGLLAVIGWYTFEQHATVPLLQQL